MNVDLTPLVQALAALALAAVTAITPFLSLLLRRYLHVRLTAAEAAAVQSAADAGAKAAYGYIAVHNAAIGTWLFARPRSPRVSSMSPLLRPRR